MVAKSHSMAQHVADLEEVFGEIRKYNRRLNPEKCTIRARGRNFFGFMICQGIKANPDNYTSILKT